MALGSGLKRIPGRLLVFTGDLAYGHAFFWGMGITGCKSVLELATSDSARGINECDLRENKKFC